jgi:hypothetical protein
VFIILRAEMTRRAVEALDKNSEFKKEIDILREEAMAANDAMDPLDRKEYGVLIGLLDATTFITEAMMNDNFQRFLANVNTDKANEQTAWKNFINSVLKHLKDILGKAPKGTVLNATINLITTELSNKPQNNTTSKSEVKTETAKETVDQTYSIDKLKTEHPDLFTEILNIFKKLNQDRVDEGNEPLLENLDNLSSEDISKSLPFKTFWKAKTGFYPNKDKALEDYNKNSKPSKKKVIKEVISEKRVVSGNISEEELNDAVENKIVNKQRIVLLARKLNKGEKLNNTERTL